MCLRGRNAGPPRPLRGVAKMFTLDTERLLWGKFAGVGGEGLKLHPPTPVSDGWEPHPPPGSVIYLLRVATPVVRPFAVVLMSLIVAKKLVGRTFGERLREARENAELSQAALAESVGINRVNLSQYERGKVIPSFELACALADALGVSVAELRGEFRE